MLDVLCIIGSPVQLIREVFSRLHSSSSSTHIREFKIQLIRTTTTVKHATAHDQNHVTVHFSRVVLRLR